MAKLFFNTLYYLTIGGIGLIGLLLLATLLPMRGSVEVKVVKSGSMEPVLHVGSIVVIKPAKTYAVGDVVTFGADTKTQIPTTHRIVEVQGSGAGQTFTTKGDANDTTDQNAIKTSDIHGKMLFTVPYVGYVLAFARTKLGFFLLVGIPALLVFFEEGKNIFLEVKRMRRARRARHMPVPAKPLQSRTKIMGLVLAAGLLAGTTASAGLRGDTVAYYADTAVSLGNSLGAASDFSVAITAFALTFSDPVVDTPPVDESPAEDTPADNPPVEQPVDEPVSEVVLGDPVVVEAPSEPLPEQ